MTLKLLGVYLAREIVVPGVGVARKADVSGFAARRKLSELLSRPVDKIFQSVEGRVALLVFPKNFNQLFLRDIISAVRQKIFRSTSTPFWCGCRSDITRSPWLMGNRPAF